MKLILPFLAVALASQASAEVSQSLDRYCGSIAKSAEVMMAMHQTSKMTLADTIRAGQRAAASNDHAQVYNRLGSCSYCVPRLEG
ncbi:MAG: hypothetical protein GC186_12915 [Rhodobacteraceae bacterium]|nr:hypothetical protein [Paracoccaceae bacterium]